MELAFQLSNPYPSATRNTMVVSPSKDTPDYYTLPQRERMQTHAQTLSDAGVIRNATKCSLTTNEFQTLPEIRGEIQSTIVNTHFYVPDQIQIVADHEIPLIKQISPEEVTRLK